MTYESTKPIFVGFLGLKVQAGILTNQWEAQVEVIKQHVRSGFKIVIRNHIFNMDSV